MPHRTITVQLSAQDVETLRDLAHYYERSMGRFRFLVRATSRADVRSRFRFVAQESTILHDYAQALLREMTDKNMESMAVEMAPKALVAFWGRLLASLTARRSRRRLSSEDIERREALSDKLAEAAARAPRRDRESLERELATRRPVEAAWMRERLERQRGGAS
jgi:hypothetical protein